MNNFNVFQNHFETWIVTECLADKGENLLSIESDSKGNYPVVFSVGGVELDFHVVAKRIKEELDNMVTEKAIELLDDKYRGIINEIADIQERISDQKDKFKYDWED